MVVQVLKMYLLESHGITIVPVNGNNRRAGTSPDTSQHAEFARVILILEKWLKAQFPQVTDVEDFISLLSPQ